MPPWHCPSRYVDKSSCIAKLFAWRSCSSKSCPALCHSVIEQESRFIAADSGAQCALHSTAGWSRTHGFGGVRGWSVLLLFTRVLCLFCVRHSRALFAAFSVVSYISCVCAAAIVAASVTDAVSSSAGSASAASPAKAARTAGVDKQRIRSALTVVKCHLPQHFPSRLLLKQLNSFFLSLEPK